jgi:hypothetical protein
MVFLHRAMQQAAADTDIRVCRVAVNFLCFLFSFSSNLQYELKMFPCARRALVPAIRLVREPAPTQHRRFAVQAQTMSGRIGKKG